MTPRKRRPPAMSEERERPVGTYLLQPYIRDIAPPHWKTSAPPMLSGGG